MFRRPNPTVCRWSLTAAFLKIRKLKQAVHCLFLKAQYPTKRNLCQTCLLYTSRNALSIMYSKEDILFRAIGAKPDRISQYCQYSRENVVRTVRALSPHLTMEQLKQAWYGGRDGSFDHYNWTRYYALNLHSVFYRGTLEWRCFRCV